MGRRRHVAPDGPDQRSQYLDSLLADPASVRREREERAAAFWGVHAQTAAKEAAQAEALLPLLRGADRAGAEARLQIARRALAEAAWRAGLALDGLLDVARAETAAEDGERAEASTTRARGIVVRGGERQGGDGGAADDPVERPDDDLAGVDASVRPDDVLAGAEASARPDDVLAGAEASVRQDDDLAGAEASARPGDDLAVDTAAVRPDDDHLAAVDAAAANGALGQAIEEADPAGQKSRVLPGTFAGGCLHRRISVVSEVKSVFEEVNH